LPIIAGEITPDAVAAMNMFVKAILAFCIGAGALAAVQAVWLRSIKERVFSQTANVGKPMVTSPKFEYFDHRKFHDALYPKIDVSGAAQRGATAAANRQIDLAIRAGNMVPKPPNIPGLRR
jgi:hypothetical protein